LHPSKLIYDCILVFAGHGQTVIDVFTNQKPRAFSD